jgi:hypothetical protein
MPESKLFKVTNAAPGPRQIFTARGGHTIPKGGSKNIELTELDIKGIKPYLDLNHLILGEPDEAEEPAPVEAPLLSTDIDNQTRTVVGDIMPDHVGEGDDDQLPPEIDDEKPVIVKHLGFGRWFGLSRANDPESKVTEAMTGPEAEAYAADHGIPKGNQPDPSEPTTEVSETNEEQAATPADETVASTEEQA